MSSDTTGLPCDPPARDPRDPDLVTTVDELKAVMREHHEQARNVPGLSFQDLSRHRSAGPGLLAAMEAEGLPSAVVMRDLIPVCQTEPGYAERLLAAWRRTGGEAEP